jgi:hypothetical protein
MTPTRREFIKSAGIAIASLVMARCTSAEKKADPTTEPMMVTCYEPDVSDFQPTNTAQLAQQTDILSDAVQGGDLDPETVARAQAAIERERLRACWLQLDQFAQEATVDFERNVQMRDELIAAHQMAVNGLVDAGELDAAVAEQVQMAFHAAAHHVWYMSYPLNICYTPTVTGFVPEPVGAAEVTLAGYIRSSAGQLTHQADVLAEMAQNSELDPEIVAQAQATLERDIALLRLSDEGGRSGTERAIARSHLSDEQTWALYDRLAGSDPYDLPRLDELGLEIPPEAAQAARFLIELLLE